MLEISLSAVAAFAAYTCYVIAKDDVAAQRSQVAPNRQPAKPVAASPKMAEKAVEAQAKKVPSKRTRSKAEKAVELGDPIAVAADAILGHLNTYGAASLKKLGETLNLDSDTINSASTQLVTKQAAVATKKGGYPGLAPIKS
jgi:hypothetical protein